MSPAHPEAPMPTPENDLIPVTILTGFSSGTLARSLNLQAG